MNFDFELLRVDCISEENYFSNFNVIKNTSQSLESPSPSPLFSARKTLNARSTLMHLVLKTKKKFPSIQLKINSLTHVNNFAGGLL